MRSHLPIDSSLAAIQNAFQKTANVILMAPPGSGKTLRVPPYLLSLLPSEKKIIVLVPKRIAAVSAAARIAEENNWKLGETVGYQVRFDNQSSEKTRLLFMTEGVFVKKIADPHFFQSIETVVFDEFHERSSLNDISFGYCYEQQILGDPDHPLKILVMSATLNTDSLQKFLKNSQTIQVESSPYPLQIIKSKKSQRLQFDATLVEQIVETAKQAWKTQKKDILIFLPGLHEIHLVQNKLKLSLGSAVVEILHGSVRLDEQKRILSPALERRIILSTNVAESSLTLPSVDAVIDSGLEKKSVYENKIGFQRLELKRISLFSARQRAGRAARVGPGTCYQLWHESDERSMPEQIEPEILSSLLVDEALTLLALDVQNLDQFSWLTRPQRSFTSVLHKLHRWTLISEKNKITALGQQVQRCPLNLERSLLFVELSQQGFQREAAELIAFLESTDFSKLTSEIDFAHLELNGLGRQIQKQLLQIHVSTENRGNDFKTALIQTYFQFFPEKMAQRKENLNGLSALGRGVQFANHLVHPDSDYFILLNGRDISDTTTKIDCAISFSKSTFEKLSQEKIRVETEYFLDLEKNIIYKQEKKLAGLFAVSTSSKTPVGSKNPELFQAVFLDHFSQIFSEHMHFKKYLKKINFLKRKKVQLQYAEDAFDFLTQLEQLILQNLKGTIRSLQDFKDYNLYELLIYLTPDHLKQDLQSLPENFQFPSGKLVSVDYEVELAPVVSVRIQDAFGLLKTPKILNERVPLTFELLAPNYRPAQITGSLEDFWRSSYLDVRRDLRARYPKHDWPENPIEWKPEMSKRLKK